MCILQFYLFTSGVFLRSNAKSKLNWDIHTDEKEIFIDTMYGLKQMNELP